MISYLKEIQRMAHSSDLTELQSFISIILQVICFRNTAPRGDLLPIQILIGGIIQQGWQKPNPVGFFMLLLGFFIFFSAFPSNSDKSHNQHRCL